MVAMLSEVGILTVIAIKYANTNAETTVPVLAMSGVTTLLSFVLTMIGMSRIRSFAGSKLAKFFRRSKACRRGDAEKSAISLKEWQMAD